MDMPEIAVVGLQNTKEVVEKYDGYHHVKIEDGMFITQILLPEVGKERIDEE